MSLGSALWARAPHVHAPHENSTTGDAQTVWRKAGRSEHRKSTKRHSAQGGSKRRAPAPPTATLLVSASKTGAPAPGGTGARSPHCCAMIDDCATA
eukprot:scaffold36310_cov118-Isochrysis_galbana.AAC.2